MPPDFDQINFSIFSSVNMEDSTKQLCSRVLDTDAAEIKDEADFFEIGGDSVKGYSTGSRSTGAEY